MLLHQSDLAAASRCLAEYGYKRAGVPMKTNSGAVFGSVIHFALLDVFERNRAQGMAVDAAKQLATEAFLYYWDQDKVDAICDPVPADGWLPTHSWLGLRKRGIDTVEKYADLLRFDDHELLATEFSFVVPIAGTWDEQLNEPHFLAGSVDRLAVRFYKRVETVAVDDIKSGKQKEYLRQNLQGTAYGYASTRPEFWMGFNGIVNGRPMAEDGFGAERGKALYERFVDAPRRFTWINVRTMKFVDGGFRGPDDYHRLALAAEQFAAMVHNDVYPMSIDGTVCRHCDARSICGGVGVPKDDHGAPLGK